jgi:hypothetical protein
MDDRGSIAGSSNDGTFSLRHRIQAGSEAHSASYPMGTEDSYAGVKRKGREDDHLHVMQRKSMRGAIPALPQYVSKAWRLIKQKIRIHGVVLS